MKIKHMVVTMIAASSLVIPGLSLYAADKDNPADQTFGEKMDDATITSKVKMELLGNRGTSALHTEVTTNGGVVTLNGKALNRAEKELATEVAKKVKGVVSVNNQMTVGK